MLYGLFSTQGLIERTTGNASFLGKGRQRRSTASDEDRKLLRTYSFVFKGYKLYFWEVILPLMGSLMTQVINPKLHRSQQVVVIARKVAVLALSVFLSKEELQTQSALVIIVLFAAGLLHCRYWPFVEDELNYAELASICSAAAVMALGQCLNDTEDNDGVRTTLTVRRVCVSTIVIRITPVTVIASVHRPPPPVL